MTVQHLTCLLDTKWHAMLAALRARTTRPVAHILASCEDLLKIAKFALGWSCVHEYSNLLAVDVGIVEAGEAGFVVRVHDQLPIVSDAVAAKFPAPQQPLQHPGLGLRHLYPSNVLHQHLQHLENEP